MKFWYLMTAVFSKLKNNPGELDSEVKKFLIAGFIGMLVYIGIFWYVMLLLFSFIARSR